MKLDKFQVSTVSFQNRYIFDCMDEGFGGNFDHADVKNTEL